VFIPRGVDKVLSERKILVGVTGSIAAYKSAELVRRLKGQQAEVIAVMTRSAVRFLSPLTLETLSGNPVATDLFPKERPYGTGHISLAEWADLVVVAPATANIIGKVASGIADDLLSTVIMATTAPVILAPAMNVNMYNNPIVGENIRKLRLHGYGFVEPEIGELACGTVGQGRLAAIERIIDAIIDGLDISSQLAGKKVLVTAGRTEEDLDPVRFLTNRSTGKMGYALADRARRRGADVLLVSGPSSLPVPRGLRFESIRTAEEMRKKVKTAFPSSDVIIMSAAVADFRPRQISAAKIKKGPQEVESVFLELERTVDILSEIAGQKGDKILVGFALETENGLMNARSKLREKDLDLVVLNDPSGFGSDTNRVTLIDRSGNIEQLPQMTKVEIADRILDRVVEIIRKGGKKT